MASITGEAYSAARLVAPTIHAIFTRHLAEAHERGFKRVASLPDIRSLEEIIDAAFWTSLRREEGRVTTISLAFLSSDQARDPLIFERPLSLDPAVLAKVAPAVERPGIHLGVWPVAGTLQVWGAIRSIPPYCFVLEVAAPGLLIIKHHRGEESGKFVNVAVLEGDRIKLVDETAGGLPDCPALLTSLIRFGQPASGMDSVNILIQLAVSMRGHHRGGSMLVVPAGTETWRESIVNPVHYTLSPPFTQLAVLARETRDGQGKRAWQDALTHAVDAAAGLTAVDGAAVLTSDYEVLAFGAKIMRRRGASSVERVMITEPVEGGAALVAHPEQLGGTRHLSAAQFVQDQQDAIALVASQDGHFTVFAWSPCESLVHAHRVEALLL